MSRKNIETMYPDIKLTSQEISENNRKITYFKNEINKFLENTIKISQINLEEINRIFINFFNNINFFSLGELEKLSKKIIFYHKEYTLPKHTKGILIGFLIIILNYFFDSGKEKKAIELFTNIFNYDIEIAIQKINNLIDNYINSEKITDKIKFKYIIKKSLITFEFNIITNKILQNEKLTNNKYKIINIIKNQLEKYKIEKINSSLLKYKNSINNIDQENLNYLITLLLTVNSFGNYYYYLLLISEKNFDIKNKYHLISILSKYPLKIFSFYEILFSIPEKKWIDQLSFRSLLVMLGNLLILQKIYNDNLENEKKIKNRIDIIINKLKDNFKNQLLKAKENKDIFFQFLRFYCGLTINREDINNIEFKQSEYPNFVNMFENISEKRFINYLIFLKDCGFKNLQNTAKIAIILLPEGIKNKLIETSCNLQKKYIEIFSEEIIKDIKEKNLNKSHIFFLRFIKEILGIDCNNQDCHLTLYISNFNIKTTNGFIYPDLSLEIKDINELKINRLLSNKSAVIIDDKLYIKGTLNNVLGEKKLFVISLNIDFLENKEINDKLKLYNGLLNNVSEIFIGKIYKFLNDFSSLDKKIDILQKEHPETIIHCENIYRIVTLLLKKIKDIYPNEFNKITTILEYYKNYYCYNSIDKIIKLLSYLHDIGKADIPGKLQLYSLFNLRKDQLKIFDTIIRSLYIENGIYKNEQKNTPNIINLKTTYNYIKDIFINDQEINNKLKNLIKNTEIFDIFGQTQKQIINGLLQISYYAFKKYLQVLKNEINIENVIIINNKNILNQINSSLKINFNIDIENKYTDFYLLILYIIIDIFLNKCISKIQYPHIKNGLEFFRNSVFKFLSFVLFHHRYPNLNEISKEDIKNLKNYLSKFKHLEQYKKIIDINLVNYALNESIVPERPFKNRDPITTLFIIADLIEAIAVSQRSYQIKDINEAYIDPDIYNPEFYKFIKQNLEIGENSFNNIWNNLLEILEENLKGNNIYEKIKNILKNPIFKYEIERLREDTLEKKKQIIIQKNKKEIVDTLNIKISINLQKGQNIIINKTNNTLSIAGKIIKITNELINTIKTIPIYFKIVEDTPDTIRIKVIKNCILNLQNNCDNYITPSLNISTWETTNIILTKNGIFKIDLDIENNNYIIEPLEGKGIKLKNISLDINGNVIIKSDMENVTINANNITIINNKVKDCLIKGEKINLKNLNENNIILGKIIKIDSINGQKNIIKGKEIKINSTLGENLIIGNTIEINKSNGQPMIVVENKIEVFENRGILRIVKLPNTIIATPENTQKKLLEVSKMYLNLDKNLPELFKKLHKEFLKIPISHE